jgi:hypothetical protein
MWLRASVEVDPGLFREESLAEVGAAVIQRHHIGWFSVRVDPDALEALRRLPGVESVFPVLACEDRLDELAPPPEWRELAAAECGELLAARLEVGTWRGRIAFLRQTIEVRADAFLRSHRTDAQDIVVRRGRGPGAPVVCRHSDGLRDRSIAGMHHWKAGERHVAAMWIGHLPPGAYEVEAGVDGWVRVRARPMPFAYRAALDVPGPAVARSA